MNQEHTPLETIEDATKRDFERIQQGALQAEQEATEGTSLKRKMAHLSEELARQVGCSRLEAATRALQLAVDGVWHWPLLMGDLADRNTAREIGAEEYPKPAAVLAVAWDLGDYGFTLDDLIGAVGPEMVVRPKAYKNQLSRLLRHHGFIRRQVRREGDRPLAWFHPKRCGIID